MTKKKSVVEDKTPEEILYPTPKPWSYNGEVFEILPMCDEQLVLVADALSDVVTTLHTLGSEFGDLASNPSIAAVAGPIFKAILPKATKIIAISLKKPEEWVARVPLAQRIEVLKIVLEAEDIPLLLKNLTALMALLPAAIAPTEPEAQSPSGEAD